MMIDDDLHGVRLEHCIAGVLVELGLTDQAWNCIIVSL